MDETLTLFSTNALLNLSLNVLIAVIVLILTITLSKIVKLWIKRIGLKYKNLDDTLFIFLSNIASIVIQVFGIIFILQRFGFETTSIVALLGAAGLAIGLALQGTLSNFAAGIMLIVRRPFKQGDFIEVAGTMGTVKEISKINNSRIIIHKREGRKKSLVDSLNEGINISNNENIIWMDADFSHPPNYIEKFIKLNNEKINAIGK